MPVVDGNKLRRELLGKYNASEDRTGAHPRYSFLIDGQVYGGAKISHSRKKAKTLDDFIVSSIARKFNITPRNVKEMEQCTYPAETLYQALKSSE